MLTLPKNLLSKNRGFKGFLNYKTRLSSSFTLIELLIVIAIIGILAGVGVPMYNGYMTDAKINATKANHAAINSFISSSLTRCSTGSATVLLPSNKTIYCHAGVEEIGLEMVKYFRDHADFKNPYWPGGNYNAVYNSQSLPILGASNISGKDNDIHSKHNKIWITTNIGDKKGGDFYLRATIVKE